MFENKGGVIVQNVRERHTKAANAIKSQAALHVPADQRYIVIIYDGPEIVGREASYFANNGSHADVAEILPLVAADAKRLAE